MKPRFIGGLLIVYPSIGRNANHQDAPYSPMYSPPA